MPLATRIFSAIRNLFSRRSVERDLDDELRSYVDAVAAEKMCQGATESTARRAALIEAGGLERVKDDVRDARSGAMADIVLRDIRFATRSLARTPAFTLAAAFALALGIGATTAILSVVNGVLLRPLPYADSDRLMVILHGGDNPVASDNFRDWRAQTRSFTDLAAAQYWTPNLTDSDEPEQINALHLTAGMLPMLGIRPLLGRVFTEAEDVPGAARVAVIGYGLWQRQFAGDRSIVGRQVSLNGEPYTIVGVMPSTFHFAPFWATRAELWAPLAIDKSVANRSGNSLRVFGRLRPGVTEQQARADLDAVTSRLEQQFPGTNRNVTLQSLKHKVVGNIETALLVLLVAVAFVLMIACANVAHMLLARASSRQKELAIRTALGATRGRLIAQLLTESALLALLGGAGGLLLAFYGVRLLVAASPATIPRVSSVSVDGRVLLMTLAITAATSVLFGLLPALRAARVDLAGSFKDGDRASTKGRERHRLRSALVTSEFALALVLLVGAGLMMRTFNALRRVDPGFDPENVITMTISAAGTKEADSTRRQAYFSDVLARVQAVPGVQTASYINHLPIAGDMWGRSFYVEGRPRPKPGDAPSAVYRVVYPGYFRAMRIPVLRGRDVTDIDRAGSEPVVVINAFMANKHWPGEDAIGKRIAFGDSTWIRVVGVTKNTTYAWSAPPSEELFLPYAQSEYRTMSESHYAYLTLVARVDCGSAARCDATRLAAPIVAAIRSVDRRAAISAVQSMSSVIDLTTAESRFYLVLLGAFASIALVLAAVGIYGVMSYSVARRTHEIGIRIALGSEPRAVLRFIVRQGMSLVLIGAAFGLAAALVLTRLMKKLLYGVAASDLLTFVVVTVVLCAVAFFASYLPARRATRIDPLVALRSDC
jgi:putative ABC transport system permease protein